ncbi:hypothetical protein BHE74_00019176 [Ensete ventricosum]|nr:hypothetical protein BHE74_00019176 [Ensete ventricosum]RZR93881.1 hypothetical protein BHM03_00022465 [Ensete ventricosum]
MGGLLACPGWFSHPVSRIQAVYPLALGSLPIGRWQRGASQAKGDDDDKGGRWQHGAEEEMMTLVRVVAKEGDSDMGLYRQMAAATIEEEEL